MLFSRSCAHSAKLAAPTPTDTHASFTLLSTSRCHCTGRVRNSASGGSGPPRRAGRACNATRPGYAVATLAPLSAAAATDALLRTAGRSTARCAHATCQLAAVAHAAASCKRTSRRARLRVQQKRVHRDENQRKPKRLHTPQRVRPRHSRARSYVTHASKCPASPTTEFKMRTCGARSRVRAARRTRSDAVRSYKSQARDGVPENHRHEVPGAQLSELLLNRARRRHPHGASRSLNRRRPAGRPRLSGAWRANEVTALYRRRWMGDDDGAPRSPSTAPRPSLCRRCARGSFGAQWFVQTRRKGPASQRVRTR